MNEGRLLPQHLQAERAVLGSSLLDNDVLAEVMEIVTPADFHADAHKIIFRAMLEDYEANGATDTLTLASRLEASGLLADIGGAVYLLEVHEAVPHAGNAKYYAGLVSGCSRRRKAIEIGRKLVADAFNMMADSDDITEAARAAAEKLAEATPTNRKKSIQSLEDQVGEVIKNLEAGVSPTKHDGISDIDEMIGGSADGEVIVIAASTSHGKTLVALQWLNEASRNGVTCGMISEEMSSIGLASRVLNAITCVQPEQWMQNIGQVKFEAKSHFEGSAPVLIAEKCGSIAAVERQTAELVAKHGVKLIAVDYAQLIRGEGGNRQERVADVSTRIKHLAMQHSIRVLLLAQLNRAIDMRHDDPTPQLSDIADTSQIAKDADVVLMPFHPIKVNDTYPDPDEYRIYHRKNRPRGIAVGALKMRINKQRQRIESCNPTAGDDMPLDWR